MPDPFKPRWEALNRSPLGQISLAFLKFDREVGCSPDRQSALGCLLTMAISEDGTGPFPVAEEMVTRQVFTDPERQLKAVEQIHRRLDPIAGSPTLQEFLEEKDPQGAAEWLLQELDLTLR